MCAKEETPYSIHENSESFYSNVITSPTPLKVVSPCWI